MEGVSNRNVSYFFNPASLFLASSTSGRPGLSTFIKRFIIINGIHISSRA